MKYVFSKSIMFAALVVITGCGDKGGSDNKQAQVPGIQGRVNAVGDANTYCDLTGTTVICYSRDVMGAVCNTSTDTTTMSRTYSDNITLCNVITHMQNEFSSCNVSQALSAAYTQYNCVNLVQQGGLTPVNPGFPSTGDASLKTVQCELEAYRYVRRWWGTTQIGTPKITAQIAFTSSFGQEFDLRRHFPLFDFGKFGTTRLVYIPAGAISSADSLKVVNEGFSGRASVYSQVGYAGQPVSMDVLSDDGTEKLSVSCAGQSTSFRKNTLGRVPTFYRCVGTSSLYGSRREKIDVSFPYNAGLMNTELPIGSNLVATVIGDTGGLDNARISFTARGVATQSSMISSSYLKANSILRATDGLTNVDLKCGPQ